MADQPRENRVFDMSSDADRERANRVAGDGGAMNWWLVIAVVLVVIGLLYAFV